MTHYDCHVNFKKQVPIYRPAFFDKAGINFDSEKIVIVLDLPAHRGLPDSKLYMPADHLYQIKDTHAEKCYPGTTLLALPHQLQQASQAAGVSLEMWDAQALLCDLDRVRRAVPEYV